MKIEKDKYYLDGCQHVIRVLCIDRPYSAYPVVGMVTKGSLITKGSVQTYTASGSVRHDSTGKDGLVRECDEHGRPIAPDPAPGQVWEGGLSEKEYLLNSLRGPNGRTVYIAVSEEGSGWDGITPTPAGAVRGLTFVREDA